jgi:predicted phosphodiesterase
MFDKISWLHISDLHLKRQSVSWSQDVVLRALHKAVSDRSTTKPVNLVLATGDLSYSGSREEFTQVAAFFEVILKDLGLSHGDLFVVPGNHDNDLSVQKYSVAGARATAISSGLADALVGDVREREQILSRQSAYREFINGFFPADSCRMTPDGLGYVAKKTLSPLRISIMGLNSAWLCHSGQKDRGSVVIGERQVIDAIYAAQTEQPHFIVALIHHPTFWLCQFEHKAVEDRLRQSCDFVLRGHLHETDIQTHVIGDRKCVFVAAGASFETRESRNSFNYVELNIGEGLCTITPFEYKPIIGAFTETEPHNIALAFRHLPRPKASHLAHAIAQVAPEQSAIASYLACLLSGDKSEFLGFDDGRAVFLSLSALGEFGAGDLATVTKSFLSLRNLCYFAETSAELLSILANYRDRLVRYGQRLLALAEIHPPVRIALSIRDEESKTYAGIEGVAAGHFTVLTLRDLRRSGDLNLLKQLAGRYVADPLPEVRREALRGLARVHAHSSIEEDRNRAAALLREVCDSSESEAEDFAILIQLLIALTQMEEGKKQIRIALKRFPERIDAFVEIGMALVKLTEDRAFRDELLAQNKFRSSRP